MTFKCHSRSSNVLPIRSSYMSCYLFMVTFAVSLTVSEIQAVLMLKTTFLPTQVILDFEFEDHAVGMWRPKFGARKLESWGCHMVKKS